MLLYALHWQRINFYVSAQSALEELPPTLRLDKLAEYPLTEGQFMELSELLHQANGGRLTNYKQRTGYDPLQAAHPPTMLHGSFVLDFNPATDALQAILWRYSHHLKRICGDSILQNCQFHKDLQ